LQARGLISVVVELMVPNSKVFFMTSFGNDKLCLVHSTVIIGRRKGLFASD